MFSIGRASFTTRSASPWAKPRASRRTSIARWGAALPLIAVVAMLRSPGAAEAQDSFTPAQAQVQVQVQVQAEARWSLTNAKALLKVIRDTPREGLNPGDYSVEALNAAVEAGQSGPALDATATTAALLLAHDYANGRIDDKASFDWHIAPPMSEAAIGAGLTRAIADKQVDTWLTSLLPANDQYRALRTALAQTDASDVTTLALLRSNMERWRWMPRNLGDHYLYVNIPAYELADMQDGQQLATYNVVVGAPNTPTPQLALYAQSIIVNPSWTVPPAVLKEGKLHRGSAAASKGYSFTRRADGSMAIRQAPGPMNALGRIKFDMPNPYSIYLHDTPGKGAFAKESRALSHGCIRVQNIDQLAMSLRRGDDIDNALAERTTRTVQLEKSIPVYIVYFTAQADADGTIRPLPDPYARDAQLTAKLNTTVQMASR
jgi:murein L,D-transpeptidase YcbB/YkuD